MVWGPHLVLPYLSASVLAIPGFRLGAGTEVRPGPQTSLPNSCWGSAGLCWGGSEN